VYNDKHFSKIIIRHWKKNIFKKCKMIREKQVTKYFNVAVWKKYGKKILGKQATFHFKHCGLKTNSFSSQNLFFTSFIFYLFLLQNVQILQHAIASKSNHNRRRSLWGDQQLVKFINIFQPGSRLVRQFIFNLQLL
jgi:hypothetical protein